LTGWDGTVEGGLRPSHQGRRSYWATCWLLGPHRWRGVARLAGRCIARPAPV